MKMSYVHVPTPHNECNDDVQQTCMYKTINQSVIRLNPLADAKVKNVWPIHLPHTK